jgi:hypothetical protein
MFASLQSTIKILYKMLIIDKTNYSEFIYYQKSCPSTILEKYAPNILKQIAKNYPNEVEISPVIMGLLVEYLSRKLAISNNLNVKTFKAKYILYAGILFSMDTNDKKLLAILKDENARLLDINGLEKLLKISDTMFSCSLALVVSNHLKCVSQNESILLAYRRDMQYSIEHISRSAKISKSIHDNKDKLINILLNLPLSFTFMRYLGVQNMQHIMHVVMYLISSSKGEDQTRYMMKIMMESFGSKAAFEQLLLINIIKDSTGLVKKLFGELLPNCLQTYNFSQDVLRRIYDLNLGLRDYKWLNFQINHYLNKTNDKLKTSACGGVFVTPESFNMMIGNEKYHKFMRAVACMDVSNMASVDEVYKIRQAIVAICNVSSVLNLKTVATNNTNIANMEGFAQYLESLICDCNDHKLKVMAVTKNLESDNKFLISGHVDISLILLSNGDYACYEPHLKQGYMLLSRETVSDVVDYVISLLQAEISNKNPNDKLHILSLAKYSVEESKQQVLAVKPVLTFATPLGRVRSANLLQHNVDKEELPTIVRASSAFSNKIS